MCLLETSDPSIWKVETSLAVWSVMPKWVCLSPSSSACRMPLASFLGRGLLQAGPLCQSCEDHASYSGYLEECLCLLGEKGSRQAQCR